MRGWTRRLATFAACGLTLVPAAGLPASIGVEPSAAPVPRIVISGDIATGDAGRFVDRAETLDAAAVVITGPGGRVEPALEIGREIRARGYSTVLPPNTDCAAACALAWLAGAPRYMATSARLSFHAGEGSAEVRATGETSPVVDYLEALDLHYDAVWFITRGGAEGPAWLEVQDARVLSIEVSALPDEFLEIEPQVSAGGPAELQLPRGLRWIVMLSGANLPPGDIAALGRKFDPGEVRVVGTRNGSVAVVAGPFPADEALLRRNRMVRAGDIPGDSYLSSGNGFVVEY